MRGVKCAMGTGFDWLINLRHGRHEMFKPFGAQHLIVLAVLAALGLLITFQCRRAIGKHRAWTGRLLALSLVAYAATVYIQKGIAGELDWRYALPLELCQWVMIAAVFTLFRPTPWLSEIVYFWGTAGTLQATLTPDIYEGFPSWEFILFFWSHGAILLAILFLIVGQNFRPRRNCVWRMMAGVNFYAAAVGLFDLFFKCNYGYLCQKPVEPSLLDYLGPWPWYLASLEIVALVSFWLLFLPWKLVRRENGR